MTQGGIMLYVSIFVRLTLSNDIISATRISLAAVMQLQRSTGGRRHSETHLSLSMCHRQEKTPRDTQHQQAVDTQRPAHSHTTQDKQAVDSLLTYHVAQVAEGHLPDCATQHSTEGGSHPEACQSDDLPTVEQL